ncbi:uncharacterized protein TrAFT101_011699 [Trichoderma asperellum]|uniref:Uncharacterized protein n=1 Tax=Trichoderma asperellum (strain ATCC 204424 / CBS 433.97 / NBRC 101777) TaxID=1042311 RepID=A0A2T3Z050_TRIA4|nr:hypothetical protein M441DRAFT_60478 [Trichoderma asperellum CBS 433.97]PTB38199.1 hypothetical protein M441DRAFT_60478 [Trichoderma asperellum CBS 433.97]UKZ96927.1 hypothetical protein TrAFT101_011699 [Trichoderma asperellum]
MAPTSRIQRRQTDVGRPDGLVEKERQTRDASCTKRWLRFRCKKKSLEVNVSLQGPPTENNSSTAHTSSGSDIKGESSQEPASEPFSAGELLKRTFWDLLGGDGSDDESGDADESEDEDDSRNHVDFGVPLSDPLSQLLSHPLPLPSLIPNPIAALIPRPPPESSPPPAAPPVTSSPPPAAPPATSSPPPPPPAASPAAPPAASPAASPASPAASPSQSHVPPSISIPPRTSPTDGISENLGAPSPSTTRPPGSSFSAPLPKSTSTGDDSDDDDDGGDDSDDDGPSSSIGKPASSTRTRSTLTAIAPPYETQTTGGSEERSTTSRTKEVASSFTTSVILPDHTASTTTRAAMTSTASPSGTAAAILGHGAAHRLSPAGEKAVIASTTIGGFVILLALAWFLWRSAKRKSAGRKHVWPASRDMLDGPRRISNRVTDRFASMKGRLLPAALGWCSIDESNDEKGLESEKAVPKLASNNAGLLERRLGSKTPPQHVTVNSYGMIFRTPIHGDSMSDILERPKVTQPPATAVAQERSRQMAAAHLESARASVSVSAYNSRSQSLAPSRKNTRISDVSSLSSGFGDGDIIITQPPTAAATYAVTPTRSNTFDTNINLSAVRTSPERKSFNSRFSRSNSRDTVMTNSSEDLRPRFRTVSSWVHQQSRRTKQRSAARRSEDRGMPTPLPEQGFDMMMPDGEVPRRVDSSLWKGK